MQRNTLPMHINRPSRARRQWQFTLDTAKAAMFGHICTYCAEHHGATPTIRDLAPMMGYKSNSSAYRVFAALVDDGLLVKIKENGSYYVAGSTWTAPEGVKVE